MRIIKTHEHMTVDFVDLNSNIVGLMRQGEVVCTEIDAFDQGDLELLKPGVMVCEIYGVETQDRGRRQSFMEFRVGECVEVADGQN